MVPLSTLVDRQTDDRAGGDLPLQPLPHHQDIGANCARLQFGPGRAGHGGDRAQDAARRLRLRVDRHGLPAEASQGKEGFIFGFAGVLVFLFLAALYESWSIPFAVVLAVPLGMFGALLRGLAALLPVRRVHADRHRDADRTGGQERDSDRRVREAAARRRACRSTMPPWKPPTCGCGRF